jgi:hypothetical protein
MRFIAATAGRLAASSDPARDELSEALLDAAI